MKTKLKMLVAVAVATVTSAVTAGTYLLKDNLSIAGASWVDVNNPYGGALEAPQAGSAYWVNYYPGSFGENVFVEGLTEDYTFSGTEIKFYNDCNLIFRQEADVVVSLPLNYDYGQNGFGTTHITTWANSRPYHVLSGSITSIYGQNAYGFALTSDDRARGFEVRSTISGWMPITVTGTSTANGPKRFYLNASSLDWKGKFAVNCSGGDAAILFRLGSSSALPHPESLTADAVTLSGAKWEFVDDQTVEGANCGITIGVNGLVIDVSEGKRTEIDNPIYGAGPIVKKGLGTLVFGSNALENYTGTLTVQEGSLGDDYALSGGSTVYLSATQKMVAHIGFGSTGDEITLDLTDASQTIPYIVAGDGVAMDPAFVYFDLAGTYGYNAYAFIKAPKAAVGLSDLVAKGQLAFKNPLAADLSVVDNGDGTETLFVTPVNPATVYRKAVSESDYDSALYGAKWKHDVNDGVEQTSAPVAGGSYNFWHTYDCGGDDFLFGTSGTFAGKHLFLNGGEWYGWCAFHVSGDIMIPRATMKRVDSDIWGVGLNTLSGAYYLSPYSFYADSPRESGWNVVSRSTMRRLNLAANLSGSGTFRFTQTGNPAIEAVNYMSGDNSNFLGDVRFAGQTNCFMCISSESNLGANPLAFNAEALRFNGMGLCVTNSVTLDDSNRGITLDSAGGACSDVRDENDAGTMYGIEDGDPRMTYPGGAWLKAADGTRLEIKCPVAGNGSFTLVGQGEVALAGTNTFSGGVAVRAGILVAESAKACGSGPVSVAKDGVLMVSAGIAGYGLELDSPISFEAGAKIGLDISADFAQPLRSGQSVPLLLLAENDSVDLRNLKIYKTNLKPHSLAFELEQETVAVGGVNRTLVSAKLCPRRGLMLIFK